MELDIRGEMEAAAAELEAQGDDLGSDGQEAPPASDEPAKAEPKADDQGDKPADPPTEDPPPAADVTPKADEDELPLGGSIPVPRVRKILENARRKAAEETAAGFAGLDWAKGLTKEEVEAAVNLTRFANEQPTEFVRRAIERLRNDEAYAPDVKRILDGYAAKPAAEEQVDEDPRPAPDVLLEDGRLVYSDGQQTKLLDWHERRVEAKFTAKLQPLEKRVKQEDGLRQVEQYASDVLKEVLTWPGMDDKENKAAVAKAMVELKLPVDAAYRKVVLPKLTDTKAIEERVRKKVLAELKTKARAGSVNPQPTGGDPADYKKMSLRGILEATADELGVESD